MNPRFRTGIWGSFFAYNLPRPRIRNAAGSGSKWVVEFSSLVPAAGSKGSPVRSALNWGENSPVPEGQCDRKALAYESVRALTPGRSKVIERERLQLARRYFFIPQPQVVQPKLAHAQW